MDCRDRGSHARGVYPTQDTSRMGTADTRIIRKWEEANTGIIAKEEETDTRIINNIAVNTQYNYTKYI